MAPAPAALAAPAALGAPMAPTVFPKAPVVAPKAPVIAPTVSASPATLSALLAVARRPGLEQGGKASKLLASATGNKAVTVEQAAGALSRYSAPGSKCDRYLPVIMNTRLQS